MILHILNDLAFCIGWLNIGIIAFIVVLAIVGCACAVIGSSAEDRITTDVWPQYGEIDWWDVNGHHTIIIAKGVETHYLNGVLVIPTNSKEPA